jgi:MFS transporter, FLVCR family, feline leukemia virus subgroup C receptor-related protein
VNKSDSVEYMQTRFYYLLIPFAVLSGVSTVLTFFFVKDQPIKPPSLSQLEIQENKIENTNLKQDLIIFKQSLLNLFKNLHFNLIFITYGINTGIFYSISTLLNQIINEYYPVYIYMYTVEITTLSPERVRIESMLFQTYKNCIWFNV